MKSMLRHRTWTFGVLGAVAFVLTACGQGVPPYLKPVPPEAVNLMAEKGMRLADPVFIRIFKEESELEVWKQRADGRFHHFKTYPICTWSGALGPKIRQGDKQSPEGFYTVANGQLNPNSQFHLSFNLGFPNAYDTAHGRTGDYLMVHGDCRSAGCYAMTDALIEEVYALVRESLASGQDKFNVHAFPFRMTDENFARHRRSKWAGFWAQLKEGYDSFEQTRQIPKVDVCARRYLVNAKFRGGITRVDASGPCPPYTRIKPQLLATAGTGTSPPRPTIQSLAVQSLRSLAERPNGAARTRRGFGFTGNN